MVSKKEVLEKQINTSKKGIHPFQPKYSIHIEGLISHEAIKSLGLFFFILDWMEKLITWMLYTQG